jgi:hypothetical protein
MPKTPSASENIPSVNAYKNVFFVRHIYKSATSSHSKPGLFGTTTLTLLLRRFANVITRDSRTGSSTDSRIGLRFFIGSCMSSRVTPDLGPRRIPESAVLRSSRHRQLEVPGFRMFVTPFLHRSRFPNFGHWRIRGFTCSRLPKIVNSLPLKNMSRKLCQT